MTNKPCLSFSAIVCENLGKADVEQRGSFDIPAQGYVRLTSLHALRCRLINADRRAECGLIDVTLRQPDSLQVHMRMMHPDWRGSKYTRCIMVIDWRIHMVHFAMHEHTQNIPRRKRHPAGGFRQAA